MRAVEHASSSRRRLARALAAIVLAVPGAARADTVSLGASKDTTLYSDAADRSNGAGTHLFTGQNGVENTRRALIAFDVAGSLPAGSTINTASLTLYVSRGNGADQAVELHRLLAPWGEAGSAGAGEEGGGALAELGDATWTHRIWNTTFWTVAGGDFAPVASATQVVGAVGTFTTWTSPTLIADVQGWLDAPATNEGWAIVSTATGATMSRRFDSRTIADPSLRPQLFVDFTPAVPVGACCAIEGTCSTVEAPGASCVGTYQGTGTDCGSVSCPQPPGACCFADAGGTCSSLTADACGQAGGSFVGQFVACNPDLCPVVPTAFLDPLPIPPAAVPTRAVPGEPARFEMAIREFEQQLHSELPPTRVWGFDDGTSGPRYPGPTFDVRTGEPIEVVWRNDLRDENGALRTEHILPVDPCMMGAEEPTPRTVIHFHGGHVAADSDGHPEATFLPGQQVTYEYPNAQRASTLWYHDHAIGITRLNVYMGMAGAYVLRDDEELALGLPSGANDIPLVIQDRRFSADGSLRYPQMWEEHGFGNVLLVNGRVWPRLDVPQGKVRFRMLNGSGSRTYRLALSNGASFQQIGSDGGLLAAPVTLTSVLIQPGERADVVIDFAPYAAGTSIVLGNDAAAPFPSGTSEVPTQVMRFDVTAAAGETQPLPATLSTIPPIDEAGARLTRDFILRKEPDACAGEAWKINGLSMDDITETPVLGTTEIWRFFNDSGFSHPMHMHLVMFRVLDRQPYDLVDGVRIPSGPVVPPAPEEAGWKDTVRVDPFTIARVIARFEDYTGLFSYHCHILEHEDHDMMRQFLTTTECGDGARGMPQEECDDGNDVDGDGCSAECLVEGQGGAGGAGGSGAGGGGGSSTGGAGPGAGGGGGEGPTTSTGTGSSTGTGPGTGSSGSGAGGEGAAPAGSGGAPLAEASSGAGSNEASSGEGGGDGAAGGESCYCGIAPGIDRSRAGGYAAMIAAAWALGAARRRAGLPTIRRG